MLEITKSDLREFAKMAKNVCKFPKSSGSRYGFVDISELSDDYKITLHISRDSSYRDSFYLEAQFYDDNHADEDGYLLGKFKGSNASKIVNEMLEVLIEKLPLEIEYYSNFKRRLEALNGGKL